MTDPKNAPPQEAGYRTQKHPASLVIFLVSTALALPFYGLLLLVPGTKTALLWSLPELAAILAFLTANAVVSMKKTEFSVSGKKLTARFAGIMKTSTIEMPVSKMETIDLEISRLGERFGFGTVTVTGTGGDRIVMEKIRDPRGMKDALSRSKSLHDATLGHAQS